MAVKVGDKVTTTATHTINGIRLASFVRSNTYDVIQVGGRNLPDNRVVIGKGSAVTAAVDVSTLTVVGGAAPVETPVVAAAAATSPQIVSLGISGGSDILAQKILNNVGTTSTKQYQVTTIDGSKVQYRDQRYDATQSDDYNYAINQMIESKNKSNLSASENDAISKNHPNIIQNRSGFPNIRIFDNKAGYYRYDYYMNYDKDKLSNGKIVSSDFDEVRKASNIDVATRAGLFKKYTENYNKFKLDNPNDHLTKTFAHVFFVRPDCNIFSGSGSAADVKLTAELENLSEFYYAKKHSPEILRQLTMSNANYNHEFMMYPSNKARSFQISDEYITTDTYGQGLTGYKIPYGKHNVESRTAQKFSINYVDDRDLHIYNLHKLWIDYISYAYRGKIWPKEEYIMNKIIDYATCVYYILCAEDGETVIFWSKYWGVFPIEAPSSSFSYSADSAGTLNHPELSIEYQYAWKEDFNPFSLVEFNLHSSQSNHKYINNYQNQKLGTGYTWSGAPFVETFNGDDAGLLPYTFKLRFRPM